MYENPKKLRNKLQTPAARAAFDALNSMKPSWRTRNEGGEVLLSTTIAVRRKGMQLSSSVPKNWEPTYDDAILRLMERLKKEAGKSDRIIVPDEGETPFIYDRAKNNFMPCPD